MKTQEVSGFKKRLFSFFLPLAFPFGAMNLLLSLLKETDEERKLNILFKFQLVCCASMLIPYVIYLFLLVLEDLTGWSFDLENIFSVSIIPMFLSVIILIRVEHKIGEIKGEREEREKDRRRKEKEEEAKKVLIEEMLLILSVRKESEFWNNFQREIRNIL
jgi:hypothetical protein